MQTFLPFPDFRTSLECLDTKRLGKQRVEAMQLIRALENPGSSRWENHPACKMWQGHIDMLKLYHDIAIDTWVARGFRNTMQKLCKKAISEAEFVLGLQSFSISEVPSWLGHPGFHRSHQSNLIRKKPEHYSPLFPAIPNDLPYIWPLP